MRKIYEQEAYDKDGNRVTLVFYGGLACPNPRESAKNTRVIRREDDIHSCLELTDEEITMLATKLGAIKRQDDSDWAVFLVIAIALTIGLYYLFAR